MTRYAFVIGWILSALGFGRNDLNAILNREYTAADHDEIFQQGTGLLKPYMRLHDVPPKRSSTRSARNDLNNGIHLLKEVIKINPQNWPAYWTMGKAYQALDEHELACDAFQCAYDLQRDNPDVAREYMNECLDVGKPAEAIEAAKHALTLKPDDPGLQANLALACLFNGQFNEALMNIEVSIAHAPDDEISKRVKQRIIDVREGRRRQPKKLSDLK
jgi:cytochrome c-type biogenesis protein CcmH/NrfG